MLVIKFVVGGLGFEFCVLVAGWRHALRSEWPFIIILLLSACVMLQTLKCDNTGVADLGPLSACMMLQTLDLSSCCGGGLVEKLGPLSACTILQTLDICHCMRVADLGPLSACMMLQTLDLRGCEQVAELGPLAACPALVDLSCDAGVPLEQIQYVQAACGSLVVWQYDDVFALQVKHPALHPAALGEDDGDDEAWGPA